MFCAISGEPPKVPVVSKKSGLIYEQRLIKEYLERNGKDPVTDEELSEDDLVEIKASPKTAAPRPPNHSSVPSLLASLQNEYDALMFEMFALKKSHDNIRQELAHALYANDAANRVIARILWERDEARSALGDIKGTLGVGGGAGGAVGTNAGAAEDAEMAEASTGLSSDVVSKIDATAQTLSSQRRAKMKRKPPTGYAVAADVKSFAQSSLLSSMHSTKPPGVTALEVSLDGSLLLTGGNDKQVQVFDSKTEKTLSTLKGHTKKITRVAFAYGNSSKGEAELGPEAAQISAPKWAVSASEDKTVRVWALKEGTGQGNKAASYSLAHTLTGFRDTVTGLSVHPSGDIIGAASRDGTWSLHDLNTGNRLLTVDAPTDEPAEEAEGGYSYESFEFHPDGLLAAAGTTAGAIRVWDIKSISKASTFRGHKGILSSLSFSENGYYLAAASSSSQSSVKVWDLRKLSVAGEISLEQNEGGNVTGVAFDPSAQFLAVVGTDIRLFANKTWDLLARLEDNAAEVTSCGWDRTNGALITAGLDRTVRIFGVPS